MMCQDVIRPFLLGLTFQSTAVFLTNQLSMSPKALTVSNNFL